MTETDQTLPPVEEDEGHSIARLHGLGCFHCGTTGPPLHPDGRISTPGVDGVVHDWDVVTCTACLLQRRAATMGAL